MKLCHFQENGWNWECYVKQNRPNLVSQGLYDLSPMWKAETKRGKERWGVQEKSHENWREISRIEERDPREGGEGKEKYQGMILDKLYIYIVCIMNIKQQIPPLLTIIMNQ